MYEQVVENVKEMASHKNRGHLLKDSLWEIKFSRKSLLQYCFSITTAMILSYIITYKSNTVELMLESVEIINGVALAFIAIIFGTYSIFQALMTDDVIWALVNEKSNLLSIGNKSFLHWILLYLINIIINVILLIVLKCIPNDFCFFENVNITNATAFGLECIYFGFCFLLFFEMKNFTVNMYQMFNVYNSYRTLEILKSKLSELPEDE